MTWFQCSTCGYRVWTPGHGTDAYRAAFCAACGRRHDPNGLRRRIIDRTVLKEMGAPDAE